MTTLELLTNAAQRIIQDPRYLPHAPLSDEKAAKIAADAAADYIDYMESRGKPALPVDAKELCEHADIAMDRDGLLGMNL